MTERECCRFAGTRIEEQREPPPRPWKPRRPRRLDSTPRGTIDRGVRHDRVGTTNPATSLGDIYAVCTPSVLWWFARARVETGESRRLMPRRRRCRTPANDDADANDLNVAAWRDVTWRNRDATWRVTRVYVYPAAACMNPEKADGGWPARLGFGDPACSWQFDDSLRSGRDQDGATSVLTLAEGRPVSWTSPPPAGGPSIMSREFYVPCTPYVYQVRRLFSFPIASSCTRPVFVPRLVFRRQAWVLDANIRYFQPFYSRFQSCVGK